MTSPAEVDQTTCYNAIAIFSNSKGFLEAQLSNATPGVAVARFEIDRLSGN